MTVYYYDLFTGTAGTLLTSHTADSGATWPIDDNHLYNYNSIQLDGNAAVFLEGTQPTLEIPSATQPSSQNFEVLFTFKRLSALSGSSSGVELLRQAPFTGSAEDYAFVYNEGSGFTFLHAGTPVGGYAAGPAVGTIWYLTVDVSTSGADTSFASYYSTTSGGTWTALTNYSVATPSDAVAAGLRFVGTSATTTTGHHIGRLVVQDPSSTTATLSGPTSGNLGSQSRAFTVTLDKAAGYGGITVTPASTGGSDTFQATLGGGNVSTITIAAGSTTGTFYLTPAGPSGNRSISITTSPALTYSGSPITYSAAAVPTAATLSGPTSGIVGVQTTAFTVTLNQPASTGGVTVTPASSNGSDTFQATQGGANVSTITIPAGSTSGTFSLTPGGTTGNRTISISAGSLSTPGSPLTYDALTTATTYAVTGASGGHQLVPVTWTITLTSGDFSGTITATPGGGTGQCQIYQTFPVAFSGNGTLSKTFTFTPIGADSVTLTFTNSGSLTNPSPETYVSTGIYLEDTFTGSTGTPIQNHSSNALPGIPSGSTWSIPTGGNIQLDGLAYGGTFFESSGTSTTLSSAKMPTALPYEVVFSITQYSAIDTIADVILYQHGSTVLTLQYRYNIGFTLNWNGSGVTGGNTYPDILHPGQGSNSVPFGTHVYLKCDLLSNLNVNVYWSTSLSGPWTLLFNPAPSLASGLTFPAQCGLQYSLSTHTSSTGVHIGAIIVQDIPPAQPTCSISNAYVTTGGQSVAFFFERGLTGSGGTAVIPTTMNYAPSFFRNGTSLDREVNAWITGYHSCAIVQFQPGTQINPGDVVTVSTPASWMSFGTTDSANQVTNLPIANHSGMSCFGTNTLVKTFKPGLNFSHLGSTDYTLYNVPKNWRYRLGMAVNSAVTRDGYPRHMAATTITQSFLNVSGTNFIDSTGYPGVPGFWAIGYDDNYVANGGSPTTLSIVSQDATQCTVQQITGNNNPGIGGIGQYYLFQVQLTAGSATANTPISLQWTNSAQTPYVSNLWIVGPGDFTVPGAGNTTWTFDRSQPYALSGQLLSRLANGAGSMRWIDATLGYANYCNMTEPWEEPQLTDFSWSCNRFQASPYPNIAYSQARPFSPSGSFIYQAFIAGQRGSTWTCSSGLSAAITDTISTSIMISSANTDPIFSGIIIQIDSEQMYVRALTNTITGALTVIRGFAGTAPATHLVNAPVTILSKRWAWTSLATIIGLNAQFVEFVTTAPHGLKGPVQFTLGGSFPLFTFTDGSAGQFSGVDAWPWVTGPSTFMVVQQGSLASFSSTISGGSVTNLTLTYGGFGYIASVSNIPIIITGGGGNGASAYAVTNSSGVVTGFTGLVGGSGYTSRPTVSIPFTNNAPTTLSAAQSLAGSTVSSWNPSASNGLPMEFIAMVTGSFPGTHLHVNIPLAATDAYVYDVAIKIVNNFPPGRRVYVELADEPWNWAFNEYGMSLWLSALSGVSNPYYYIVVRTGQIRTIFRNVFGSRANEIYAMVNIQWGGAPSWVSYTGTPTPSQIAAMGSLQLASYYDVPIDANAVAPYVNLDDSSATIAAWNSSTIQQMADLWVHDMYYNTQAWSSWTASQQAYIAQYNATPASPNYNGTAGTCFLYGYEAGFGAPPNGINNGATISHDIVYDPDWLIIEQDFYALLQASKFVNANLYSYDIYYDGTANWGLYHSPYQPYGIGDGSDGKANNRLCLATPGFTHTKAATTNQDQQNVSVRGQAFLDWMQPAQAKKRMLSVPYRFVNR
ncbi:MAG: beta strand repeat-containing protein [Isosphaeraceae bacterium]